MIAGTAKRRAIPIAGVFWAALWVALLALAPSLAWAVSAVVQADEAWERARNGQLLIIDVRSPREWRATGVPKGAVTIPIAHEDGTLGFGNDVEAAAGSLDQPIALICARGGRSARAVRILSSKGFRYILDITEGVLGGRNGPGWISRGLPTDPYPRPAPVLVEPEAAEGMPAVEGGGGSAENTPQNDAGNSGDEGPARPASK